MKPLLLFILLAGVSATRAQGLLIKEADLVRPPAPQPGPSASVWGLTTAVERPQRGPLLIVNGQVLPDSVDGPPAEDIIGLRELEPAEAVARYGQRAQRGALLIDTQRKPRRIKK